MNSGKYLMRSNLHARTKANAELAHADTTTQTNTRKGARNTRLMDLGTLLGKLRGYDRGVDDRILNIYQWGSRVYGTNTPESDWDFVIVSTKSYPFTQPNTLTVIEGKEYNPTDYVGNYEIFDDGEVNVTFVELAVFKCMIMSHRLEMLESLFLPSENVWLKKVEIEFMLDLEVFRKAVSWEAVRTSHKAEVKMAEGSVKKGKKELFHAIRYLMFALQIIRNGKIADFSQANSWWEKIRDTEAQTWDVHKQLFMPVFHDFRTQFISECPLGVFHSKISAFHPPLLVPPPISHLTQATFKNQKELKVVNLIKSMGLEIFCGEYGISYNRHSDFPNLVFLNTSRWRTPKRKDDDVISECSGIVLDECANWSVVCFSYNKMVHLGMGPDLVDWSTATIHEKLDGDLCILWAYGGKWLVSSKYSVEGINPICSAPQNAGRLLKDVFWEVWDELKYSLPNSYEFCYMFELLHPQNRYAIKYGKRIVLHGARNMQNLEEMDPEPIAVCNGWEFVKKVGAPGPCTKESVTALAKEQNPYFHEGFVVRDSTFNRVIVKAPYHVSLTCLNLNCTFFDDGVADLMASTLSRKDMLDIVRHNDEAEFAHYFPQWADLAKTVRQNYEVLVTKIEKTLSEFAALSPKEFALAVQTLSFKSLLFTLRKSPISAREYLATFDLKRLLVLVEEIG